MTANEYADEARSTINIILQLIYNEEILSEPGSEKAKELNQLRWMLTNTCFDLQVFTQKPSKSAQ